MNKPTILMIDDEKSILEVTSLILEHAGYHPVTFLSANDAIDHYAQHTQHIDAVMVDMNMHDMNGVACIQALRAINPHAAIVLSSGQMLEDITSQYGDIEIHNFLKKPYMPQALIEMLATIVKQPEKT